MAKVLVVEDQPSVIAIVRYHLESAGFGGLFASNVEEAWRLLAAENPDAAVVDIKLQGASGWTLIEKIRDDGRFHELPIIMLTGLLEPEVAERAGLLQCEYLTKPFAASALLSKIRGLLEGKEVRPRARGPGFVRENLVAVGVVLFLDQYQIEGKVHLPPELARFSDAWESVMRDQRDYLPVTDVRVSSVGDRTVIASPTFIVVRKADVRAVYPVDVAE